MFLVLVAFCNETAAISLKTITFTTKNSVWSKNFEIFTYMIEKETDRTRVIQRIIG